MTARLVPIAAIALATPLAGCSGWQSALDPHSDQAGQLGWLIWGFIILCAVIWVAVMVVLFIAILRRRPPRSGPLDVDPAGERRAGRIIAVCAVGTTVIVLALSVVSYAVQRTVFAQYPNPVVIHVIGHQWWWEIRYEDPQPSRSFTTANEIHVPVGRPVSAKLDTSDVIHSFWVPSLTGKKDLINGQQNAVQFTATKAGVYRGQCAEFCGLQHALMAFEVIAEPPRQFDAWRQQQAQPARDAKQSGTLHGEEMFRRGGCALCHAIRGTLAGGQLGPDLTHIASRRSVAAGTLPMSPGALAAWIADPQHVKPGVFMPQLDLNGPELTAIVQYLETLK